MKEKKSNLDERQEQVLLKIEHNGCWLAFWGLLTAIIVQALVFDFDIKTLAGEWIIFILLCLYIGGACAKQGIWDRRLQPDPKTNFLISLMAGLISGSVMFFMVWKKFPDKPVGAAASGVFFLGVVLIICYAMLSISAKSLQKRQEQLEREEEESEDRG